MEMRRGNYKKECAGVGEREGWDEVNGEIEN